MKEIEEIGYWLADPLLIEVGITHLSQIMKCIQQVYLQLYNTSTVQISYINKKSREFR